MTTVDPLSDILDMVTVEASLTSRLDAAGAWALRFCGVSHVKFGVVLRGTCWISAGGDTVRIGAGDSYLLTAGAAYVMSSDPEPDAAIVESAHDRFLRDAVDGHLRLGAGSGGPEPDVSVAGGRFVLDPDQADILLGVLPPVLVVPADPDSASAFHPALALLDAESADGRPRLGSDLVRSHLAHIVLVQALRAHVERGRATHSEETVGWLAALADPRTGPALHAVHADPMRPWTVAELAALAHLAPSTFAAHFRRQVGQPPADYVLRLRMRHAVTLLRRPGASVTAVGRRLGYSTHSSFSHAFSRVMGESPSRYRRRGPLAAPSSEGTGAPPQTKWRNGGSRSVRPRSASTRPDANGVAPTV